MSLLTVPPAIVTLGKTVSGITSGEDPPPPKIDTAQLPFVYCLTRDGAFDWTKGGTYMGDETREFAVQVAVIPTSQGTPNEREERCRPLIDAFRDKFASYPQLNAILGVQESIVNSITGPVILPEYGGKFIGFEMSLSVRMVFQRTFCE